LEPRNKYDELRANDEFKVILIASENDRSCIRFLRFGAKNNKKEQTNLKRSRRLSGQK
jgi:hypothetical protein